ncbi:hypothetical protein BKH42_03515 [Helicobacter sp. 13S00482-2]|uniref:hypothetical protein n=1 Tax=Helicobacter sp. 13S00482-2 TaxID=1476200 RepID=UPI000BA654EC|nr:hypothetical protein [Helicobacter sp. 13S00482-2]PAF53809.1 hypothetical protein BKH42_03515 [Helicobacter sp. 13S00482-2]
MRRSHSIFKNPESLKFYNLAIWIDAQILKKSKKDIKQGIILKQKINAFYEKSSLELDEILRKGGQDDR